MGVDDRIIAEFLSLLKVTLAECSQSATSVVLNANQSIVNEKEILGLAKDLGQTLHSHCTKFALACRPPSTSNAVEICVSNIQDTLPTFTAMNLCLDEARHGTAFCERIRTLTKYTLTGLATLIPTYLDNSSPDTLRTTGIVWESCVDLQQIPTAQMIVCRKLQESIDMIGDAVEDLQSFLEDDDLSNEDSEDENSTCTAAIESKNSQLPHQTWPKHSNVQTVERCVLMFKRIQILARAFDKQLAQRACNISYLNLIYDSFQALVVLIDDLAGEIQEFASPSVVTDLENSVVARVKLLCDVNNAPMEAKWIQWVKNFQLNWLQTRSTGKVESILYYSDPPQYELFLRCHLRSLQPCLINNLINDWSCMKSWRSMDKSGSYIPNYAFLKATFGSTMVNASQKDSSQATFTFTAFLDLMRRGEVVYARDMHFSRLFPAEKFYSCPPLFQDDWLNFKLDREDSDDYKFVYAGASGTKTKLHRDVVASHSWSSNITGYKIWTLIPPQYACHLFNEKSEAIEDLYHVEEIKKWPGMHIVRSSAIIVFQQPGETMFVPSGWYHQVENIGPTISINHNWINAVSLRPVFQSLEREVRSSASAIGDLLADGVVSEHKFASIVQELTMANAGMDWTSFFGLILFRLQNQQDYIHADLRPNHSFEAEIVSAICEEWHTLEESAHLSHCSALIQSIRHFIFT